MTGETGTALRCRNDDAAAIGTCHACGRAVCGACVSRRDGDVFTCRQCAYSGVLESVARDTERRRASAERVAASAAEPPRRGRGLAAWAVAAAVVVLLGAWTVSALLWTYEEPSPRSSGAVNAEGLDACVQGLWDVREAMDVHLAAHGGPPDRLAQLADAPASCPGCGGAWRYTRDGSAYEVACPAPGRHGRAAVLLDHTTGAPQVVENRGRVR